MGRSRKRQESPNNSSASPSNSSTSSSPVVNPSDNFEVTLNIEGDGLQDLHIDGLEAVLRNLDFEKMFECFDDHAEYGLYNAKSIVQYMGLVPPIMLQVSNSDILYITPEPNGMNFVGVQIRGHYFIVGRSSDVVQAENWAREFIDFINQYYIALQDKEHLKEFIRKQPKFRQHFKTYMGTIENPITAKKAFNTQKAAFEKLSKPKHKKPRTTRS